MSPQEDQESNLSCSFPKTSIMETVTERTATLTERGVPTNSHEQGFFLTAQNNTTGEQTVADLQSAQQQQQQQQQQQKQLVIKRESSGRKSNIDLPDLPRVIERNRPFFQSANKINTQHNQGVGIYKLLKHNWFHAALRWPTIRSVSLLLTLWTGTIIFFAGIYVLYDNLDSKVNCGLGPAGEPIGFAGAFAFSLETCTTVGE
jgi:hypothetical protein